MRLSDYDSGVNKVDENTKRSLRKLLKGYEGKSEAELIDSIVKVAAKKRAEGTLTDKELDAFYKMIAPSVTAEQRKKLDEVVAMLKNMK